jgi:hypothetical protein
LNLRDGREIACPASDANSELTANFLTVIMHLAGWVMLRHRTIVAVRSHTNLVIGWAYAIYGEMAIATWTIIAMTRQVVANPIISVSPISTPVLIFPAMIWWRII